MTYTLDDTTPKCLNMLIHSKTLTLPLQSFIPLHVYCSRISDIMYYVVELEKQYHLKRYYFKTDHLSRNGLPVCSKCVCFSAGNYEPVLSYEPVVQIQGELERNYRLSRETKNIRVFVDDAVYFVERPTTNAIYIDAASSTKPQIAVSTPAEK